MLAYRQVGPQEARISEWLHNLWDEVSTESGSDRVTVRGDLDQIDRHTVAIAPGTDSVFCLRFVIEQYLNSEIALLINLRYHDRETAGD